MLLAQEHFRGQVWDAHYRDVGIMTALNNAGLSSFRTTIDFLGEMPGNYTPDMPNVITEPPAELGAAYARRALDIVTAKVALLLPTSFLTAQTNYPMFTDLRPSRIYMLMKKPVHRKTSMAWLVWEKGHFDPTVIRWV